MQDSDSIPSPEDVDYNNSLKASLTGFMEGRFNRVRIYGAGEEVKELIIRKYGIDYDDEIMYGFASNTGELGGGISNGGSNLEFFKTTEYGIWFELEFNSLENQENRKPSMVALVRISDGKPPTYQ